MLKSSFEMDIFSPSKPHLTTIIDVGSSSIGAATVLLYPDKKPKIIHSVRSGMIFQENFRFERFVISMLDALGKVTLELSSLSLPPYLDHTFLCVLASPWYASQTRILKKTFDRPTKIDEKFMAKIREKEVEDFKEKEMAVMGNDAVILEIETIQTKLNGYETADPFGKESLEFQAAMYVSISPHEIIQSITEKMRKAFHGKIVHFSTFPFASFISMRDIFHEKNFLLMDISGEVTDISIIKDNVLQETMSFTLGKNFLLRKISSEIGSTFEEAVSQFRMLNDSEMQEDEAEKIEKAMKQAGKEWIGECENILLPVMQRQEILPRDVFITADEDVSKWFINNLQEMGDSSFLMANNTFSARHLNQSFLSSFCDSETGTERDSFLMLESLFAKRFIH